MNHYHYHQHPFITEKTCESHYYHHTYAHHHVSNSNLRLYPQTSNFRNNHRFGNDFGFTSSLQEPDYLNNNISTCNKSSHDESIYSQQQPNLLHNNGSGSNHYSRYTHNDYESASLTYRSCNNNYTLRDTQPNYDERYFWNDYYSIGATSSRNPNCYSNTQQNNSEQSADSYHSCKKVVFNEYTKLGNQDMAEVTFGKKLVKVST